MKYDGISDGEAILLGLAIFVLSLLANLAR